MGGDHHGYEGNMDEKERERMKLFVDEFMGKAQARFPMGQLDDSDHGETAFAIAADPVNKLIRIQYTKPVTWIGMYADDVRKFITLLEQKLKEIE